MSSGMKLIKEGASWLFRLRGPDARFEKDPVFRAMRDGAIQAQFESLSVLVMVGSAIINGLLLCLAPLAVYGAVQTDMAIYRAVIVAGLPLFFLVRRRSPNAARWFSNFWITAISCAAPFLTHPVATSGLPGAMGAPTSMLLMNCFLLGLLVIGPSIYGVVASGLMLSATFWCFQSPAGVFDKYLVIVVAAMVASLVTNRVASALLLFDASREAMRNLDLLPRDILRTSTETGATSSGESLRPSMMGVVCLASDWRGYQALTRRLTPQEVTDLLGRYYEICHRLLGRNAGKVRFASDWIADELLVYFLFADEAEEKAATAAALTFARALVVEKKSLVLKGGGVVSIDVGIASGQSLVGLAGVEGRQKLMAIGPVLGEARRLQSCGKALRAREGEKDRIISSARVAALGGPAEDDLVVDSALAVA